MRDGFLKVAAATPEVRVADCAWNRAQTAELMRQAAEQGVKVVCFPELGLTGYTCADLFLQSTLLRGAERALEELMAETEDLDLLACVGVPVRAFSVVLVLLSSLLAACVTAFAGPISFVGIAVPHLVKHTLGSAKPLRVLPGCALGGAAFCLLCDLIARSLFAPTELSISSVTAVFGAPVVIWLLVRRHSGEGTV